MNMQGEYLKYINKMSQDLANEIDFDILTEMLQKNGWTLVVFDPFDFTRSAETIEQWAQLHCTGLWRNWTVKFVFERAEDATCAVLKWN